MILKNNTATRKYKVGSTMVVCENKRAMVAKGVLNNFIAVLVAILLAISNTGCKIYKFSEAGGLPAYVKTANIRYIENKAQYINPQLSPRLSDKLRQKVMSQTKLSVTNVSNEDADLDVRGFITDYRFSTSAISGQQVATNRLTVSVHVIILNRKAEENNEPNEAKKEYDVSRSFEFKGNQSFQQAEASLGDEIIRTLTDEIFNKLFSNW